MHVINLSLLEFADALVLIEWTPTGTHLGGYCQALFRVQQECAQLLAKQEETRNVLSATYQKEKSQAEAYEQWVSEWHKKPCTSITYCLSLLVPPDGNNHPLWVAMDKAKPTRSSFCTTLCLAVGHTFVSEYTCCFKHNFEPLDVICKCGFGECTLAHIIFDCKLLSHACDEADIDKWCMHPSLNDLLGSTKGAAQLYKFLNHAAAMHKPAKPPWLPGTSRMDPHTDGWYWDDSIM